MTETISLELAKEIAEKYRLLGVDAPTSKKVWWDYEPDQYELFDRDDLTYENIIPAYTAAEIFDALPGRIVVEKDEIGYWVYAHAQVCSFNKELVEALGRMLCRVLDEKIKLGGAI